MAIDLSTAINNLYGQLRGYRRIDIRKEVAANTHRSQTDLLEVADVTFDQRVRDAIARFPAYADAVKRHRGSLPSENETITAAELPVWTKADQQSFFKQLDGPPIPGAYVHSSGGSTGVRSKFYVTRYSYEWRTAIWDRAYSWAGAQPGVRSVYFWSRPLTSPPFLARARRDLHNWMKRRRQVEILHKMDLEQMREACALINRFEPEVVLGYAHYLVELARFARDNPGVLSHKAPRALPVAEWVQPGQRELIEEHLCGEVYLSYGAREFMSIGMECGEHNGYHLNIDNLWVEIADDNGAPVAAGEPGRVLVTDLRNDANPFVRYDLSDVGVMAPLEEPCSCGLPFPRLLSVEGRVQDQIAIPDGGYVSAMFLNLIPREFEWIEGYQLVQLSPRHIRFQVVTQEPVTNDRAGAVERRFRERLGADVQVDCIRVDELTKGPSGKVAFVINEMEGNG